MLKIPTKVLPKDILDAVKRTRPVYKVARGLRFALGERLGARHVSGLGGRVHYNDFMLTSPDPAHVESYLRGALEFVDILERSCAEAGHAWSAIAAALEIGCGYGRIVRELVKRMPASRVSVSDVIDPAARFTASEFGVHKVPVLEDAGMQLDGMFDLVYLLSVYTHLRSDMIAANLARVTAVLKPGGVAVLTVHGQGSAETLERYSQYWLDKARVLDELARAGYYYERYPYYYAEYGLTWFTCAAFEHLVAETAPSLAFVSYHPTDVDGHQDVFVYRKS
ncbi:MAG: class I SAM-dependent methyltransferase [Beijerinckiaceae bacterium]